MHHLRSSPMTWDQHGCDAASEVSPSMQDAEVSSWCQIDLNLIYHVLISRLKLMTA